MHRPILRWAAALIFVFGAAAAARAQDTQAAQALPPAPKARFFSQIGGPAGDPGENAFFFSGPVSGFEAQVVTGAPFSAQIANETVQVLADGNRIDRKSTGTIARDSLGRTRREISFRNIGPLAAAGQAPELAFINDPAAGKVYTLDETRKTAVVMSRPAASNRLPREFSESRRSRRFEGETKTEALGQKTIEGLVAQGTRVTRTIAAGEIGNEKPIVITTERWYSPDLQMTILLTRSDPRFGTTTYQLTNIDRSEPPQSSFMVPPDYTVKTGREFRMRDRPQPNPDGDPEN